MKFNSTKPWLKYVLFYFILEHFSENVNLMKILLFKINYYDYIKIYYK
jgi:hypothetical protein